jgi:hypothetical protein
MSLSSPPPPLIVPYSTTTLSNTFLDDDTTTLASTKPFPNLPASEFASSARILEKLVDKVDLLAVGQERLVAGRDNGDYSASDNDASIGARVLLNLEKVKAIEEHRGVGASVLTDEEHNVVRTMRDDDGEQSIVARMTRHLERLDDRHGMVLSNTENLDCLVSKSKTPLKPDLWILHSMVRVPKAETGREHDKLIREAINVASETGLGDTSQFLFGGPPPLSKMSCFGDYVGAVLEFKIEFGNEVVGQIQRYVESPGLDKRAILFVACDRRGFWLIYCANGSLIKIVKCASWTASGSLDLIRNALTDPNMTPEPLKDLIWAQERFAVEGYPLFGGCCWLGMGANGRVFSVKKSGEMAMNGPLALKVVNGQTNVDNLKMEFEALRLAFAAGCPVVEVLGKVEELEDRAAYLMKPVGKPIVVATEQACKAIFEMLATLHHKGFTHGDPRLANAITTNGESLWIDMRESVLRGGDGNFFGSHCLDDARKLSRSILKLDAHEPLPSSVYEVGKSDVNNEWATLSSNVWQQREAFERLRLVNINASGET